MANKAKPRVHREHFRQVSLGGRKSCPSCGEKLNGGSIWSWGEYVNAKWRTVKHFCEKCFPKIRLQLLEHKAECGCAFELKGYHCSLPKWLTLTDLGSSILTVPKDYSIFSHLSKPIKIY